MRRHLWLLALGNATAVASCSTPNFHHTVEVEAPLQDVTPRVEPLPVRIGVLYTADFRRGEIEHVVPQYTSGDAVVWYDRYQLRLGSPSVAMLDRVLPAMFADVVRVETRPPLPDTLAVDAVLEPQIVTADAVAVVYRFVLYAPDGATIMAWTVRGEGRQGSKAPTADNLSLAMRDAAARLLIEFLEQPEVVAWVAEIGRTPATRDDQ